MMTRREADSANCGSHWALESSGSGLASAGADNWLWRIRFTAASQAWKRTGESARVRGNEGTRRVRAQSPWTRGLAASQSPCPRRPPHPHAHSAVVRTREDKEREEAGFTEQLVQASPLPHPVLESAISKHTSLHQHCAKPGPARRALRHTSSSTHHTFQNYTNFGASAAHTLFFFAKKSFALTEWSTSSHSSSAFPATTDGLGGRCSSSSSVERTKGRVWDEQRKRFE